MALFPRLRERLGGVRSRAGEWITEAIFSTPDPADDRTPKVIAAFRKAWGALIGGLVGTFLLWIGGKLGVDLVGYHDAVVDFSWNYVVLPFFGAIGSYLVGPNKPRNT